MRGDIIVGGELDEGEKQMKVRSDRSETDCQQIASCASVPNAGHRREADQSNLCSGALSRPDAEIPT